MQNRNYKTYSRKIILVVGTALIIAACTLKKVSKSTTTATPVSKSETTSTSTTTIAPITFNVAKSADGIYAPGNEELVAIQLQYKDVTLDKLKEGHALYTKGACVNCHSPESIYKFGEGQWYSIIEDMARKANITDAQKDAVYKYVLAIKATQSK